MKNFTLILMVALLAFSLPTQAQRNYDLTIDAGSSVDGTYPVIPGGFGSQDYCSDAPLTGEWVVIEDTEGGTTACNGIVTDLTGKIALIDRGDCQFGTKCLNAENQGAIAVIVCNNADTAPITMGPGDVGDQVTIPCFMAWKEDCDQIRVELPLEITLEPNYPVDNSTDVVVWGDNPGEGDFDGGLNGWTVNNISCAGGAPATEDLWRWTPDGFTANAVGAGANAYGDGFLASVSACNGGMVFQSDFYDNGGVQGDFGLGICPVVQEGELISPVIDISNVTSAGLTLRFDQVTRQFQSEYYVGWSTDGGATWTEAAVNAELPVNSATIADEQRIPMPGVVGNDSLMVKFRYVANYYYWGVDDVKIVEQEAFNLQIANDFYAVPQNQQWPYGHLDPIAFLADVGNVGALSQDNVTLNMTITEDAGGTVIYEDDKDYGTVDGNTVIENEPFSFQWIPGPDATVGAYSGEYVISGSETDFDEADNSATFSFMITDNLFAKEDGFTRDIFPATTNYDAGEAYSWAYGNHYYVENSMDMVLDSAQFIITNGEELINRPVLVWLYTWVDDNADGNADPSERTKVALGTYIIEGTETSDQLISVPMSTIAGDEYALEDNTEYILMVEYLTEDPIEDDLTLGLGASDDVNYSAMILATTDYFSPRYASMLGVNGTLEDEPYGSVGFGQDLVPVVRLKVKLPNNTNELITDGQDLMDIFPVPAKETINVQFKLDQPAVDATLEIVDLSGRSLLINQYQMILNDRVSINVSNLKNGIYLAVLRTEEGVQTERFVIQK